MTSTSAPTPRQLAKLLGSPLRLGAADLPRTWQNPPHLRRIDELLLDLAAGVSRRLALFAPPRHGKSVLTSHYFPAWFLLTHPHKRVILASYEADFAARFEQYGDDLKVKTFQGAFVSAADYIQAQRQRRKLAQDMARTLAPFDVLLTAANFRPAPRIEQKARDSGEFFQRPNLTAIFNVTANPAISVCNGFAVEGLPLACQIAGKPFDERTVLRVAHAYEQATVWHKRRPALTEAIAA